MADYSRYGAIVLLILGIGFITGGTVLFIVGEGIIDSSVTKGCELKEGTLAYKAWLNPPVPLKISFYVFNITNPRMLNTSGAPQLNEIGPFVYKEVRTKEAVEHYPNGTISYRESRSYTYLPDESVRDPKLTNITTINIVYMTLVNFLQTEDVDNQWRKIVGGLLSYKEKPLMTRSVDEILWGYDDPLLKLVNQSVPGSVQSYSVSIFNASASQAGFNTFLVDDGVDVDHQTDRIKKVGNIEGFNGQSRVSFWSTEPANMINGTDSTLWHPGTTVNDEVYIFTADLCRSLRLAFQKKLTNDYNVENYRFVLPPETFKNSLNQDFCLNTTHRKTGTHHECLPDGLMSLQTCIKLSGTAASFPTPIITSAPHFLDGDPELRINVSGLDPIDDKHRSYMDVEPRTGTVMSGARRMQVNLNVLSDPNITLITNYSAHAHPMIWLEEHAQIDKASADEFNSNVSRPILMLSVLKYSLLVIGIVLFLVSIALFIRRHYKLRSTGDAFTSEPDETTPLYS